MTVWLDKTGVDLLTAQRLAAGEKLTLAPLEVRLFRLAK